MATINTEALQADFDAFEISEELGFILKEPLTNLPDYYRVWLDLANNLTTLIESPKLRDLVHEMPMLSPHLLSNHRELRLAQLVLGFLTMGYVWQNGRHAPAQGALMVTHTMKTSDLSGVRKDLIKVSQSLRKMKETFKLMHSGSAAQSSAVQCFDALLCVRHEDETGAYLTRMRDYMPPAHSQLIETLSALPPLRDLISSCSSPDLCQAFSTCVSALVDLRSYHLNTVTKYVVMPANQARAVSCPLGGVASLKGTGGSDLMVFLKSAPQLELPARTSSQASPYYWFSSEGALVVMHSVKTSDLSGVQKGLIKDLISSCSSPDLCQAYNTCVSALVDLRSYHLNTVTKYVVMPANQAHEL
ncbi:unnamed protein product [Pleuronectes platessa]|uniref:Indoleamine 2,3-dioxygenase n=1 Tax=Pleuronectes platessa TaxID=8262 RepID=A0A9N7UH57_PLEPL|nr:unnamed protein product [Pleuronectes platessa]